VIVVIVVIVVMPVIPLLKVPHSELLPGPTSYLE
jgi:hypothetical protein